MDESKSAQSVVDKAMAWHMDDVALAMKQSIKDVMISLKELVDEGVIDAENGFTSKEVQALATSLFIQRRKETSSYYKKS